MEKEKNLNAISPYFTMFPLDFPMRIIEEHSTPGDLVLDPFCGRGTTNFAARLLGRKTYGIDCNPMAVAVSRAKMIAPKVEDIISEAKAILARSKQPALIPYGEFWATAFHAEVLKKIVLIRDELIKSCRSDSRIALRAIMLGALHGPRNKGKPSYFSNQCPRTYAPKPDYAVRFWKTRGFKAPEVDVLDVIRGRAERYYGTSINPVCHTIVQGDCRQKTPFSRLESLGRADLIVTSPPYPGMVTYSTDQWLRYWFVGGPSTVDYYANAGITSLKTEDFITELKSAWNRNAEYSKKDAILVCRFGVLPSYKRDKTDIIQQSFRDTPWKIRNIFSAGVAKKGKRVAESFMVKEITEPNEEIDVVCMKAE